MIRVLFPIAQNLVRPLALKFDKSFEEPVAQNAGFVIKRRRRDGAAPSPGPRGLKAPSSPDQTSLTVSRFIGAIVGILCFL